MKKLLPLLAALALFGAACASNTTLETATNELVEGEEPSFVAEESTEPDANEPDASEPEAEPADEAESSESSEPAADSDGGDTTTAADPTPEPPAPTEVPEPEATEEPGTFEPTADQLATLQAIADADDWCSAAQAVEDGTDTLDDLDFTNPVELEGGFTMALAVISAAQPLAPAEIKADVDQTVEAFATLANALEDANWSFLDLDLAIIEQFDGPMELATYNIDVYNSTVCGIDVDPGEPPVPAVPGSDDSSDDDDLPIEGTIREQAIAGLVDAGFTEEEASCVLSKLDLNDPEAFSDMTVLLGVFSECGLSLDRLAELGG